MVSVDTWKLISGAVRFLKYGFAVATTILSLVSMQHDTTFKTDDPILRKKLTPVGFRYMIGVLTLAALTIVTNVVSDSADAKLAEASKADARIQLDKAMAGNLDKQYRERLGPLLSNLEKQVQDSQSRILHQTADTTSKLDNLNQDLSRSTTQMTKSISESSDSLLIADLEIHDIEATVTLPAGTKSIRGVELSRRPLPSASVKQIYGCVAQHSSLCQFVDDPMYLRPVMAAHTFAQVFDPGEGLETKITFLFDKGFFSILDRRCQFDGASGVPCLLTETLANSVIGDQNAKLTSAIDVTAGNPKNGASQATVILAPTFTPQLKAREVIPNLTEVSVCRTNSPASPNSSVADLNKLGRRLPEKLSLALLFTVIDKSDGRGTVSAHERRIPLHLSMIPTVTDTRQNCITAAYVRERPPT